MWMEAAIENARLPVEAAWLEQTINESYGTTATLENYTCEVIGDGKGFLSVVTKVNLAWNAPQEVQDRLPSSVVLKIPTDDRIRQLKEGEVFKEDSIARLHNAEVNAYAYLNLFKPSPIPIPRLICAKKFTPDDKGLLVMAFANGGSLTMNESLSYEQLLSIVWHVANFQAYAANNGRLEEFIDSIPDEFIPLYPALKDFRESVNQMNEAVPGTLSLSDELIEKVSRSGCLLSRSGCLYLFICVGLQRRWVVSTQPIM